ncbi:GGDEF domain-containing protein [Citrobacter farmeri]|uniref:GGDEF domain-containing protein n=1 Tax=Citrobacter farmeri TaxID=67824 RepID=UPI0018974A43|nr:GGDEF domain-containing protein [Citrobacter farmeri]EKU0078213.1 GGDEF domain-containing protein [Citrobacter farmeri]MBJ9133575.1 GGDEF domain-containing protein [Citrobacter farmeri]MDB2167825.1 GGDEF domain-containing protein [Citrobacter farmeri]MDZ7528543.1 GGDEF domain-containing protein [Citrobacter farmeri]HCD1998418.1 GGDEF domain-containing protein [Citrobacter farmeri]
MKIVQDSLRNRQALIISALITLLFTSLFLFIIYEQRLADVNEGMNRLQTRMLDIFNDNEMIADATGVRYQQIKTAGQCGEMSQFTPRGDAWGINADSKRIHSASGAMVARKPTVNALCMFTAAEFIRSRVNALNPGNFDAHRYIIADDASYFYWFTPADAKAFDYHSSKMARNISSFFLPPVDFYTRLLEKSVKTKALSSTDFYDDRITDEKAFSVVSYIYDLSGKEISDHIVGYLVYDHAKPELQEALRDAFDRQVPHGLNVSLVNTLNQQSLCLSGDCHKRPEIRFKVLSEKYVIHYAISLSGFAMHDTQAGLLILMAPFFFVLIMMGLKSWLNESDLKIYIDSLTGCFNRKILDIIKRRDLSNSSVVLVDCNKFKAINDTWGHVAGDRALQVIANRMLSNTRTSDDLVIRTGGDEFVIVLYQAKTADAVAIAERIAHQINAYQFIVQDTQVPLSISWGVAEVIAGIDDAIQNADGEMYKMKQARG